MSTFEIKQHDTRPLFEAICTDGGKPQTLASAQAVKLLLRKNSITGQLVLSAAMQRADQTVQPGRVSYNWQVGDTASSGLFIAEVEVTWSDGTVQTFPGGSYVAVVVLPDLG